MSRELTVLLYQVGFWSLPVMGLVIIAFEVWKFRAFRRQRRWLEGYMEREAAERRRFEKTMRDTLQINVSLVDLSKRYFALLDADRGKTKETVERSHQSTQQVIGEVAEDIKQEVQQATQKVLADAHGVKRAEPPAERGECE